MAEPLKKRAKGAPVPPERWLPLLTTYADQCFQQCQPAFPLGENATLKLGNAAHGPSLVALAPLLEAVFKEAPTGVVNHVALKSALTQLVTSRPPLYKGDKKPEDWADYMATALRTAMAHCRIMVQIPARFEQRTRSLTPEQRDTLKRAVALYQPDMTR
jgi:hypothetical protein